MSIKHLKKNPNGFEGHLMFVKSLQEKEKGGILFVIFRSKRKLIMCKVRISNNVILGLWAWCQAEIKCGLGIPKTTIFEFLPQFKDLIEY